MESLVKQYYVAAFVNLTSAPSLVENNFSERADEFMEAIPAYDRYTTSNITCQYCKSSLQSTASNCVNCGAPICKTPAKDESKWDGVFRMENVNTFFTTEYLNGHPPPDGYWYNKEIDCWCPRSIRPHVKNGRLIFK